MKRFLYIGVSTQQSLVKPVYSQWYKTLGYDRKVECMDISQNSDPVVYKDALEYMKCDTLLSGVLITSHKIPFYLYGSKYFYSADWYAKKLREVSTLVKTSDGLCAYAQDPLAIRQALIHMSSSLHGIRDIVIMGAGGASIAICACLCSSQSPAFLRIMRICVVDNDMKKLYHMQNVLTSAFASSAHTFVFNLAQTPAQASALLTIYSNPILIINATGMGKDVSGSPFPKWQRFPNNSILWDLNYRGDLTFLKHAEQQALIVENGWYLALCGWLHVLERVEGISIFSDDALLTRLQTDAQSIKKGLQR